MRHPPWFSRSKPAPGVFGSAPGEQCCYDRALNLIKTGTPAGTADRVGGQSCLRLYDVLFVESGSFCGVVGESSCCCFWKSVHVRFHSLRRLIIRRPLPSSGASWGTRRRTSGPPSWPAGESWSDWICHSRPIASGHRIGEYQAYVDRRPNNQGGGPPCTNVPTTE